MVARGASLGAPLVYHARGGVPHGAHHARSGLGGASTRGVWDAVHLRVTGRGAAPSGLQAHAGVTGVVVATTGDGVDARVLISVWLRECPKESGHCSYESGVQTRRVY